MELKRYKSYTREEIHNLYSPDSLFVRGAGKWGLHGIVSIPEKKGDFIFFVTFGTTEAGHTFKEGITEDGILTWQSKPGQKLKDPQISQFINHDHNKNNIFLLLRTNSNDKYTYLGKLAYESHNPDAEKPVQFQWQILDWEINEDLFENIGLKLGDPGLDADQFTTKSWDEIKKPLAEYPVLEEIIPKESEVELMNWYEKNNQLVRDSSSSSPRFSQESKKVGDRGEEIALKFIRSNINDIKLETLVWHANIGETPGYDISYENLAGEQICIEVKSTAGKRFNNFIMTSNELRAAKKIKENFKILLVADCLGKEPKVEIIPNPTLDPYFLFEPLSYQVFMMKN